MTPSTSRSTTWRPLGDSFRVPDEVIESHIALLRQIESLVTAESYARWLRRLADGVESDAASVREEFDRARQQADAAPVLPNVTEHH